MKRFLPRLSLRLLVVIAFCAFWSSAFAQRIDVKLSGREATAIHLAVDDFVQHHYSKSGDLTRYTLLIKRSPNELEVTFVPDTDSRGPYPGGGTDYGPEMYYYLSLDPPKILKHLFAQ